MKRNVTNNQYETFSTSNPELSRQRERNDERKVGELFIASEGCEVNDKE